MDPVRVCVKTIVAQFVAYKKQNQHTTSHTDAESGHLDQCIGFVSVLIAKCYFDIIGKHIFIEPPQIRCYYEGRAGPSVNSPLYAPPLLFSLSCAGFVLRMDVFLAHKIFGHNVTVEKMYDAVTVLGIGRRVGHHHDRRTGFV